LKYQTRQTKKGIGDDVKHKKAVSGPGF